MKILLTNDDGPFGPGLSLLRQALEELGEVTVLCPAEERSGVSHAITYMVPVRLGSVRMADGAEARTLTGTPADCVKFALLELFDSRPDLLVSGPNLGVNAGVDVFYSGTVAAALEGGFYGVRSVAFSTDRRNAQDMDAVAGQALRVLRGLLELETEAPWVFNVNVPYLSGREPPVCFTRQTPTFPPGSCTRTLDSRQREHYWLDSTEGEEDPPPDSDVAVLRAGSISVTPLRGDLTDRAVLEWLRRVASAQLSSTPAAPAAQG